MLYFLPGITTATREALEGHGLAYAFESRPLSAQVMRGPFDGPAGCVCADPRTVDIDRVMLDLDGQTWRKLPGGSGACVGHWTGSAPGPEELARKNQIGGHWLRLGDGNDWLAPAAKRWTESPDAGEPTASVALPRGTDLDDEGNWVICDVLPAYLPLWEAAERWRAYYASLSSSEEELPDGDVEVPLSLADIFDDAVVALGTNYRVSNIECAMLGLLTESTAAGVLNALIDLPGLHAILQKKTGE